MSTIPLYRLFELVITNDYPYPNPFVDVSLQVTFIGPSRKEIPFWGFYDGNGVDGGKGNVWKIRFCPSETGLWEYTYRWSDGTPGGDGKFHCVEEGSGKGILQPYQLNNHWLAYNGTNPVFLRSYYVGATIISPLDWAIEKVYKPLIARGYNHLMFNQLLPVEWLTTDAWKDAPSGLTKYLFDHNDPMNQMNLEVWKNIEDHLKWLNAQDIGVFVFQGFDGKSVYTNVKWEELSTVQKDFYVRYVCSRLAPLAIIAGWNFTWETQGDGSELELMTLISRYDPWDHLRTYEDEYPHENHFNLPIYTWAAVENHGYGDRHGAESHHKATLDGYKGKPVFMLEGNGLWKAFWKATELSILRAAWAVTTAGGSFIWDWTIPNGTESASSYEMFDTAAAGYVDILYGVMTNDLDFKKMEPHDEFIEANNHLVYCLAEPSKQYLVWAQDGGTFHLKLPPGHYQGSWIDTKTNIRQNIHVDVLHAEQFCFNTPDTKTDWILMIFGSPLVEN